MNVQFFKYALEVEKTRSISQAAENLFMAQPTLSKAIKEIEEQIGYPIFARSSKGVVPTAQGQEFLVHAARIAAELERIYTLSDEDCPNLYNLRISIPQSSYIADGVLRFAASLSPTTGMDLRIQETHALQTIRSVADGQCSLGILRCPLIYRSYFENFLQEKGLQYECLWEYSRLVLMSDRHPLAQVQPLQTERLAAYPEIVSDDCAVPYLRKPTPTAEATLRRIELSCRGSQLELLQRMPSTYLWTAPVPEEILRRYDLIQRRCASPEAPCLDLLVYASGHRFSEMERNFLDRLSQARNHVAFREHS